MANDKVKVQVSDIIQSGVHTGDTAAELERAHLMIANLSATVDDLLARAAVQEQFANRATVAIDEMAARMSDFREMLDAVLTRVAPEHGAFLDELDRALKSRRPDSGDTR